MTWTTPADKDYDATGTKYCNQRSQLRFAASSGTGNYQQLTGKRSAKIRVRFKGASATGYTKIVNASIGTLSSGANMVGGSIVPITFNGGDAGINIPINVVGAWSDWIDFTFDAGVQLDLVVHITLQRSTATKSYIAWGTGGSSKLLSCYVKADTVDNDWNIAAPTGTYNANANSSAVYGFEIAAGETETGYIGAANDDLHIAPSSALAGAGTVSLGDHKDAGGKLFAGMASVGAYEATNRGGGGAISGSMVITPAGPQVVIAQM